MGSLLQARTNSVAAAIVSSLALIGRTTSTSVMVVTGLKKCTPQTRSGRVTCIARSMTGRVEVHVASTVVGSTTVLSVAKSSSLTARSSTTVSITKSLSRRSLSWVVTLTRALIAAATSTSSLPFSTWRASDRSIVTSTASARSVVREQTITVAPVEAATSATPLPMMPDPTTPILSKLIGRD